MQRVLRRAERALLGPSPCAAGSPVGARRSLLGASLVRVAGGQAASASGFPLFNDNEFTASLQIAVILYKQG